MTYIPGQVSAVAPGPKWIGVVALCLIVGGPAAAELYGNGGTLRLANVAMGAYRVSVFTDPTPVRPDSLDVSVLILREGVDGVAEGVEVWVRSRSAAHPVEAQQWQATREQADDPRYYSAKFALGHEGPWEIEVEVHGEAGAGSASFTVTAREPGLLGNPFTVVLLALLPLAAATFWLLRREPERGQPLR